jgi:deoxycytidine triphosphate deaminase
LSDLVPDTIRKLIDPGWNCKSYQQFCTVPKDHIDTTFVHRIIYHPSTVTEPLVPEFEGNAAILHIGEYVGRVKAKGNRLIVPRGEFMFFTTKERVDLPFDIDGSLFMNPRVSNLGLQFFTLGHVDPGFNGHLTATVLNTTNDDIILERYDGILYVVFSRIEQPMKPNFKLDFHANPQDGIETAQRNLAYNQRTAFAITSDKFVTRTELLAYLAIIVLLIPLVLSIIQFLTTLPPKTP